MSDKPSEPLAHRFVRELDALVELLRVRRGIGVLFVITISIAAAAKFGPDILKLARDSSADGQPRGAATKADAQALAQGTESEQADAPKAEALRVEARNTEALKIESHRVAAEKAEAERVAAEKAEAERVAAEKAEAERVAAEKAEAERVAAEKAEAERVAAEKAEAERAAAEKAEAERRFTPDGLYRVTFLNRKGLKLDFPGGRTFYFCDEGEDLSNQKKRGFWSIADNQLILEFPGELGKVRVDVKRDRNSFFGTWRTDTSEERVEITRLVRVIMSYGN